MITLEKVKTDLCAAIPGLTVESQPNALLIPKEQFLAAAKYLKENPAYQMDYLSSITAVDYLDEGYFESVSHFYSMSQKQGPVVLKVRVPRANPTLPSLTSLYKGAEFQEREAYDLFGLIYEGHPDLRRIFMWDEFAGHPMRKDYIQENQDEL